MKRLFAVNWIVCCLALLGYHGAYAQDTTSLTFQISRIKYSTPGNLLLLNDSLSQIDTQLNGRQILHPLAPDYNAYQDLGFIGSPIASLKFDARKAVGFDLGIHFLDPYYYTDSNFKFYLPRSPLTQFRYIQGGGALIYVNLLHTQKLARNLHVGVDFRRISAKGYYVRQVPSFYNVRFFGHYYGKRYGRYHGLAEVVLNHMTVQENGGVTSDSMFEAVQTAVQVNLNASQNRVKNTSYHYLHMYRFGSKGYRLSAPDSSGRQDTIRTFEAGSQIYHDIRFQRNRYQFNSSSDQKVFPVSYIDTVQTRDSIYHGSLDQELGFAFHSGKWRGKAGAKYQLWRVFQKYDITASGDNIIPGFQLQYQADSSLSTTLQSDYVVSGFNQGDYQAIFNLNKQAGRTHLSLEASAQGYRPAFVQQYFYSNHYIWNNDFNRVGVVYGQVSLSQALPRFPWKVWAAMSQVSNWIYADTGALPVQAAANIQVLQGGVDFTWKVGNFRFFNQVLAQYTNQDSLLRLPSWSTRHSWYYQRSLFKGALSFQLGTDIFYRSAFKANSYNPATRMFYMQNQVSIGDYPQIDLFLLFKIRAFNLYVKLEHLNQGWNGGRYYSTPHYPISPRIFRFGFEWYLF